MIMDAKDTAATAPTAISVHHTSGCGESIPTTRRASGSKQSAHVTSAALIHDLATRQRWPSNPYSGPITMPAAIQSGLYPVRAIVKKPLKNRSVGTPSIGL